MGDAGAGAGWAMGTALSAPLGAEGGALVSNPFQTEATSVQFSGEEDGVS